MPALILRLVELLLFCERKIGVACRIRT